MMALTPEQEVTLAEKHRDRIDVMRTRAGDFSENLFNQAMRTDDPEAFFVDRFASTLDTTAEAAARSTDAYFSIAASEQPLGVTANTEIVRGAAVNDVARRPMVEVWTKLSQGKQWIDATASGARRARTLAQDSVNLGQRHAANSWASSSKIRGYRRTLSGVSCVLCRAASTQRYHSDELMPIHSNCDCGVAPIIGNRDPGHIINKDLLQQLKKEEAYQDLLLQKQVARHKAAAGKASTKGNNARAEVERQKAKELKDKLEANRANRARKPKVENHGELGKVLTDSKHKAPDLPERRTDLKSAKETVSVSTSRGRVVTEARAALDEIAKIHDVPTSMPAIPLKMNRQRVAQGGYARTRPGGAFGSESRPAFIQLSTDKSNRHPAFAMTHEYGHFLDHVGLKGGPNEPKSHTTRLQTLMGREAPKPWADFWAAIDNSKGYKGLFTQGFDSTYTDYVNEPTEIFARAYAQFIARKSGNKAIADGLSGTARRIHWEDDDFEPIANAMEAILRDSELMK
jgi:hypothetical protein